MLRVTVQKKSPKTKAKTMNPKPEKCYSPHGYTYGIISNIPQFLSLCEAAA